jgi:heat shock protein HslJ
VAPRPSATVVALIVAVALLGTAGCATSGSDTHVLDGTAWRLTGWSLSSLTPSDFKITAQFADGRISGTSAVNVYSGPYRADSGGVFSVGDLAVSAMGATGPDGRAEHAYLTLLGEARSFKRSGGLLTLFDRQGHESLVFQATKS